MRKTENSNRTFIARIFLLLIIVVISLLIYSYLSKETENEFLIEEREEPQFTKHGELHFLNVESDTLVTIEIEVADKQDKITQGLMWRRSMGEKQGMLFVFPDERPRSFWMKNTYIPLDILYVDSYGKIVSIVYNAVPFNERSLPSEMPAQYVVEVNAGFCNQYGIVSDMKIAFEID
jgi:uncharacterized protein